MTTVTNSFEGGTSGTTITAVNSGGVSGTAFDTINFHAGDVMAYDSLVAAHGSLSLKMAPPANADLPYVQWTSKVSATTVYARTYMYLTSFPGASVAVLRLLTGSTIMATAQLTTAGKLQLLYSTATLAGTTSVSVPLNTWFRIEMSLTSGTSAGATSLQLFNSMDSVAATETLSASGVNVGSASAVNTMRLGAVTAIGNSWPMWVDDVGLSSDGWLGPSVVVSPPSTLPPSLFLPFF